MATRPKKTGNTPTANSANNKATPPRVTRSAARKQKEVIDGHRKEQSIDDENEGADRRTTRTTSQTTNNAAQRKMPGSEAINMGDGQSALAPALQAVEKESGNNKKNDRSSEATMPSPSATANDAEASKNLSPNDNSGSLPTAPADVMADTEAGVHRDIDAEKSVADADKERNDEDQQQRDETTASKTSISPSNTSGVRKGDRKSVV